MVCVETIAAKNNDDVSIADKVVAVYCQETCCVYVVRSVEGRLVELKRRYVCCGEHINVEDAIRCTHTLSWSRLTIYSAIVETIRTGMSVEGTGMTV
jgi:hypothetical protein